METSKLAPASQFLSDVRGITTNSFFFNEAMESNLKTMEVLGMHSTLRNVYQFLLRLAVMKIRTPSVALVGVNEGITFHWFSTVLQFLHEEIFFIVPTRHSFARVKVESVEKLMARLKHTS